MPLAFFFDLFSFGFFVSAIGCIRKSKKILLGEERNVKKEPKNVKSEEALEFADPSAIEMDTLYGVKSSLAFPVKNLDEKLFKANG